MSDQLRYTLTDDQMPTRWYNIVPALPSPPPPALHPGTGEPAGPDDFAPLEFEFAQRLSDHAFDALDFQFIRRGAEGC